MYDVYISNRHKYPVYTEPRFWIITIDTPLSQPNTYILEIAYTT